MMRAPRWTLKPYFNRYTHVAHVLQQDGVDAVSWAMQNLNKPWRKRDNIVRRYPRYECHSVSFFTLGDDQQALLNHFGDRVLSYGCPFHQQAETELLQGLHLALRDKLYFDRYRYSVSMHGRRQRSDVRDRIRASLGETNGSWTMRGGIYSFNLYLSEDSQLVMLRLAHGSSISKITKVYTSSEVQHLLP